ncbi:SprB repeat-containing protein [Neolewinella agarilytica]|uniref:SprB repeat-containing protein n=2 Tax=Neolewinella agarilytica TaxID=478744 RepID=A0A1H9FNG4_9BACT|nr:SprB repeat-containing protein [Neolewinella agarilytica]
MLQAQDPVMTYEMKLTRVYCGIPVNQDPYGPDPRYRINAQLRGLGTNINNNVFVSLNDLQTTGWIDIDDQVVVSGTLVPGSRTINLCNTGIDVVFDDLDAWEENVGESDGLEAGDGFPLQLSSSPGPDDEDGSIRPTGRPEAGSGPGVTRTIVVMGSDYSDPNSPFGFEFTVVYTLENVLQRVEIAGNAAGEPVADLCAGGNVYLQGVLADNFTGGVIRYEKSGNAGNNWGTIGDRMTSTPIEVEYTGFPNDRYRARLVTCLRDEEPKQVDFSNIDIFPSIEPSDITFSTASTCQDASKGRVTVNPIPGLNSNITYALQLKRVNTSGIVFDNPTVVSPIMPYTFQDVPAGSYIITASSNARNAEGDLIGDCGTDSEVFNIDPQPAPAITQLVPTNASCETPSGTVRVGAATSDFTVELYSTADEDTPVSGPVAPNAGTEHVFTDVIPGSYFVSLRQNGNGCARRSELFSISAPVNRASGSWTPDGDALTVNCMGETIPVDFTPDNGTGTNEVTLTALNVLLGGGDSQVFQRDVSAGSSTTANLRQGDYAVNFRRLDNTGCDRTYFFTVAPDLAPMEVILNMLAGPTVCEPTSGEAIIDVSGGTPGYMAEIQGADLFSTEDLGNDTIRYTFTGLTGGSYTFQVTDANGCVAIRTLNIPNPAMVNVQVDLANSRLAVDCFGDTDGSIQLTGTGDGNLTYRLTAQGTTPGDFGTQTLFENLAAGTYLAEIKDDANVGCIASQSITISEPDQLEILDVSYVTRYICDEATVDFRIKFNRMPDLSYGQGSCELVLRTQEMMNADESLFIINTDGETGLFGSPITLLTAPDDPIQEILVSGQMPGNYLFELGILHYSPLPIHIECTSAAVPFTALPEGPLFIEIIDKTDPSCYEAYDGSITLKYGGGDPEDIFDIDLYISTGPSDNSGFIPVSLPSFSYTYSKDNTITIGGLPSINAYFDLANIPEDPSTFAYFARIQPSLTISGASCIAQSHEVGGPPEELVRLVSPDQMSFTAGFTKGLECDGSGATFSISNPTGGTPPYEFSLVAGVGSATTIYDFSPQTTFDISGEGFVAVIMRDARNCVYEDRTVSYFPWYEPTQEYGVRFTPTPIRDGECPPELDEFLTGIMRVNGGLGLTTYTFSTDGVAAPAAITTADSVIFLSGMLPGTVTVFIDNPATGQRCQTATFENPAPPLPLSLEVESIQGESCPGARDAQVRVRATGGVEPLTFVYLGESQVPIGSPAVLDITNAASGDIQVGVYDANNCEISQVIDIPISPGAISVGVRTEDETPCPGTGNGVLIVDLFGGVGPYQFDWLDDGEPSFSVVQDGLVERRDLTRQRYDYRIESTNGCIVESYAWVGGRDPLQAEIVDVVQPGCSPTGSFRINITQNSYPLSSNIMASINGGPRQSELFFDELPAGNYIVRVFDDANCLQDGLLSVDLISQNNDLTISATPTDATCNGENDGQIVAQAGGGTPPYQYSLDGAPPVSDGTFTGLTASTYTIVVTDAAGCSATSEPIVISDPDPVAGEWVSITNSCVGGNNGSVTLAGTSGRAPFSYRMEGDVYSPDPVFTDLAPGAYQFQVRDADGCESALIGAPVGQLPLFSLEQGAIVAATCNTADGSSTVNVVGGNDGYSFAWPDGQTGPTATNLLAGSYDVIVTSAAGCSQTFTATVNSSAGPSLSLFIGTDACESGNGSVTVSVSSGTPPYTYAWSDDLNRSQASATGLPGGDYTITVTDIVGCSSQATATVTTTPGISLSLVSSTPNSCGLANGTATLASTGGIDPVAYSWSHDLTADGPTVSNLPNTVDVIVTATSSNGCTDQLTIPATNSIGLQGLTDIVEATSCGQDDGQITLTPVGGTPPYNYTWSHTDALTTNQAINLAEGTYAVTVSDANGCSLERDFTIISSSPIVLGTNNVTPSDCGMSNGSINVGVSGNTNSVTYAWSHDAGITGQFASGLAAGDYSITVTEDGTGCTASIDVNVTGSPNGAMMTITSLTNTSCGLDNGALEVVPAFGTPPFEYRWSHTNTLSIGTVSNLAAGTYGVTSTDTEGCTSVGSFTIAPSNAAQIFLQSSTPSACGQANGSLTVTPGFVPDPTFSWSHNSNLDGPLAENLSGGDYTVTVTGSNGCSVEATYNVANTGFNELEATGANVGCEEGSGTASVTVLNGTPPFTYDWEHAPGDNISGFIGLNSGTYNVTVTDATGCSGQTSVVVPPPAPPGLTVLSSTVSCNGLDDGSVTLAGTSGLAPFMYRIAGGTYDSSPTFSGLAPGDYQFQMQAANGCESEILDVTIDATVAINVLSADDDTCDSGFGGITVQAVGGTPPYSYAWSDDPERTVSFASSLSAGTYTITATDVTGCSRQQTVELSSIPGITVSLESSTPTACGQNSGTAAVTTTGGIEPILYAWSHDPMANGPTVNNLPGSLSTVTVTSANGCTDELTISINSNGGIGLINGSAQATTCGLDNGQITAEPVGGTAPFTYAWSHSNTLTTSPATNLAPGDYTVTITDDNGCSIDRTYNIAPSTNPLSVQIVRQEPSDCATPNGNITLETTGNVNGIRYNWSHDPGLVGNFASGLAAGDYSVTVTENGPRCSVVLNYNIEGSPGGAFLTDLSRTHTSCGLDNGSLTVEPTSGNAPFTYRWSHTNTLVTGTATNLAAGTYSVTATDADGCTSERSFNINGSPLPDLFEVSGSLPADCGQSNGQLNVIGTGLGLLTTYAWSHDPELTGPIAENLAGGQYQVTATDGVCTVTETFTVENVGSITVTDTRTHSLCVDGNGSISLTVSNGTPPFRYDWEHAPGENVPGFTDLNAGFYRATVTDATGCTGQWSGRINVDEPPTLNLFTQVHTRCGNGSGFLYVNASGGLRPYVFDWAEIADQTSGQTNGFDGISGPAGDYHLTVTDANGCTVSGTYTINGSAPVAVSVTNQVNPTGGANNGSITISTTGFVPPLTYFWSHDDNLQGPIAANLSAGTYTVGVQDANLCYDEVTVVLNSGLIAELINVNNPVCTNNTGTAEVNVLTGTAPYSYAWSHAPGEDVPSFENLSEGSYSVQVSDATGATFNLSFELEFEGGFSEFFSYSRPASCGLDNGTLELLPADGQFPYTYNWADFLDVTNGELTDLAIGDYAVTVTDGQGCSLSRVFTVEPAPEPEIILDYIFQPTDGMANGEIGVVVSGFTEPITYSWSHDPSINSPFLEGVPAGTYTLTVSDEPGCSEMITIQLGVPIISARVINLRDAGCSNDDGEATILVNVGEFPYTYEWSHAPGENVNSFDNLAGGNYMVTVSDDAGAMTVVSFSIVSRSGPTAIVATANEGTTCGESNAVLTVAPVGGNPPFEYDWVDFPEVNDPTLTELAPGDYTLTIIDIQNCSFTETFTVAGSAAPTVNLDEQVNPTGGLANGSISITTSGFTDPLTYQWSHDDTVDAPLADDLTAGSYTVSVSDVNNCAVELTVVLTEGLTAEIINLRNSVCTDDNGAAEVNVLSGTAPFFYAWSHAPGVNEASFDNLARGNYTVTVTDVNGATFGIDFFVGLELGPSAINSVSNEGTTCGENNGSLSISPVGGTAPYTFDWAHDDELDTGIATNLAAGDYEVTITDANDCSVVDVFTIEASDLPVLTISSQTNPSCGEDNGQVTVLAEGLTAPLTYVWSHDDTLDGPTATGLVPDDYTIDITDANGCTASIMLTLTGQDALATSLSERSDAICDNGTGSATISVTSGTEPFTFEWSHAPGEDVASFDNLEADDYSVTITDANGCTDVQTFSIDFIAGPAGVTLISQQATTCGEDNGSLEVAPEGGTAPYTFAWSHDNELEDGVATNLAAGDYEVTITDANDCSVADVFTIDGSATPTLSIGSQTNPSCGEDNGQITVLAEGLTAPLTYVWSHDDTLDGPTATGLAPDDYTIDITDANGCTASIMLTLTGQDALTTSLTGLSDAICEEDSGSATISVTSGTEPFTFEWSHAPGEDVASFDNLEADDYSVTITDANGCTDVQTFSIDFIAGPAGVTLISQQATTCGEDNGSLEVAPEGGTGPYTFAWSHDNELEDGVATNLAAGDYEVTITDANDCSVADVFTIDGSATPTLSIGSQTNPSCGEDNGQITVLAEGLTAPLTYVWSHDDTLDGPTATGLAPDDYTIDITDANECTASIMLTLTGQDALTTSLTGLSDAICEEDSGSATISVTSGTEPFTFEWSHAPEENVDNFQNLTAGDYGVTITDANGCFEIQVFQIEFINGPAGVNVINQRSTICGENNGTLEVAPDGGSAPYVFKWSHDDDLDTGLAIGLAAGQYEVTITDVNGCPVADVYTIDESESPEIIVEEVIDANCGENNGSILVSVSGLVPPLAYEWSHDLELDSPLAEDLGSGNYSVTITGDGGCRAETTASVSSQDGPTISISSISMDTCNAETGVILISYDGGGTAPFAYSWSHDTELDANTASGLSAGTYGITLTDATGCVAALTASVETEVTALLPEFTLAPATCAQNDGQAMVEPQGGRGPYFFFWSHDAALSGPEATNVPEGNHSVTIIDQNGCTETADFQISGLTGPENVELIANTPTSCGENNGALEVSASGGTAPFTFRWSHDPELEGAIASGLAGGTYTVILTDANNCTVSADFAVAGSETPLVSMDQTTEPSCGNENGSITVSATGLTPPFSYRWSHNETLNAPMAAGLAAGDYSVTITGANGCSAEISTSLEDSEGVSAEVSNLVDTRCQDGNGQATISVLTGNAPFTYQWSHAAGENVDRFSELASGDYSVTVTDANNCITVVTFSIGLEAGPSALNLLSLENSRCGEDNGSISIEVEGGLAPYRYAWNHDAGLDQSQASGLAAGTYNLIVTDANGCMITGDFTVEGSETPMATIAALIEPTCNENNGSISLSTTGLASPLSFTWSHNDGLETSIAEDLAAGDYSVTITGANGCSAEISTSLEAIDGLTAEVAGLVNARCEDGNGTAAISVLTGRAPFTYEWSHAPGINADSFSDLASGEYTVTITDANNCSTGVTFTIGLEEGPSALNVLSLENTSCGENNGSISISPEGGSAPFTFEWEDFPGLNSAQLSDLPAGDYALNVLDANNCVVAQTFTIAGSEAPTVSLFAQSPSACGEATGAATVSVSGFSEGFTYSWSHDGELNSETAEGLSSGLYTVTVSDATCSAALSISIESSDGPESITATELIASSCGESNGAITLSVEGGAPPYDFDWSHDEDLNSNQAEDLSSGIYQVVVTDANGCSLSRTFNVGESNALTISEAAVMGANCEATDGSISLTVINANGELTYDWSHDEDLNAASATGLTAGNYGVTITDAAGCSVEDMIMVNTVDNPATFVIAATPSNCTDGQGGITVTISDGRGPYTFNWSHDTSLNTATASNLSADTYSVLVTDAVGCSVRLEATVDLILPPGLEAALTNPTCAGAANGGIVLTPLGGTSPFSYLWSNGANTSALTSLIAGDYQVTITDANGCTATLDIPLEDGPAIAISVVDSIAPSCGSLTDGRLEIAVSGGMEPLTINWSDGQTGVAALDLAGGQTYTVTVSSTEGCTTEATFFLPEADAVVLPFPADTSLCRDDIWALDLTEYSNTSVTSAGGFSSSDPVVLLDEAGTYTVTATNASGCMTSTEVTVNVTGESFVAGFVLPSDVVVGDSVVVLETSWPAPDNLEWIFDQAGVTQVDQRQNQYWFIFDEAGEYSLSLLAGFGGCDDLLTKNITVHPDSTSIPSTGLFRTGISDVGISPNPNNSNFIATVELTNTDRIFMNLYEMDGTPVDRQEDQGGTDYTFNYNLNLEAGSYLLLVQTPTARRTVVIVVF